MRPALAVRGLNLIPAAIVIAAKMLGGCVAATAAGLMPWGALGTLERDKPLGNVDTPRLRGGRWRVAVGSGTGAPVSTAPHHGGCNGARLMPSLSMRIAGPRPQLPARGHKADVGGARRGLSPVGGDLGRRYYDYNKIVKTEEK